MIIISIILVTLIVSYFLFIKKRKPSSVIPTASASESPNYEVRFNPSRAYSFTATWEDPYSIETKSQFVPFGTDLVVCAKRNSASGGPFDVIGDC